MSDETWEAQRVNINKTLDRFDKILTELDSRSNKIITKIAVIETKERIYSAFIALIVSGIVSGAMALVLK